ncbi:MAG: succinate dehydrogenase [Gammaproteobacteria bacterium]|nr:succinate dehydrogenase [Gammaproteobacteria bacterium]
MKQPLRSHRGYLAFLGHRLSGLALALFLPLHFLLLGTALNDAASLDNALALTHHPLFRIAEWGLVVLLVLHLLFGLRVLALEMTQWPSERKLRLHWIVPALVIALLTGFAFTLRQML